MSFYRIKQKRGKGMKKRIIVLLCLVMILLIGCGGKQVEGTKYTIKTSEEEETENLVEIDPFKYITIEYDGQSYLGEIKEIKNNATDEFLSSLSFVSDNYYNLANGDKIKIYIDSPLVEEQAKKNNYVFTQIEKEYTVEGLPYYITSLGDIPEELMETLKNESNEKIEVALEQSLRYKNTIVLNTEFVGNYLWTVEGISAAYQNNCFFVYKVEVEAAEKFTYYYYICFHDLFMNENNNLTVDLEQHGDEPNPYYGETFEREGESYEGFQKLEDLRIFLENKYGDNYISDSNIME